MEINNRVSSTYMCPLHAVILIIRHLTLIDTVCRFNCLNSVFSLLAGSINSVNTVFFFSFCFVHINCVT